MENEGLNVKAFIFATAYKGVLITMMIRSPLL